MHIVKVTFADGRVKYVVKLGLVDDMQRAETFHRDQIVKAIVDSWKRRINLLKKNPTLYPTYEGGATVEAVEVQLVAC